MTRRLAVTRIGRDPIRPSGGPERHSTSRPSHACSALVREPSYAFPSRVDRLDPLSTRQYARLVEEWVSGIGLRKEDYGTHSLRRTKAALIYKQTGNLRAVQILLGHSKIETTVRYLGVEVEDALTLAEATEV